MSGKTDRRIRRGLNRLARREQDIADGLVRKLLEAPFKFRFLFAMRIIFRMRKKKPCKAEKTTTGRVAGET